MPHERGVPRPAPSAAVQERNYAIVQRDSVAVGVVNASSTFLPVLIVRLGGSGLDVSLLTSLPAVAGFLLAIPTGRFLQGRRNIVPWYSRSRLIAQTGYALIALATLLAPPGLAIALVLAIWGLATLPSTMYNVAFSVVMDGAAGPSGRYDLLGQRWAISGLATAVTAGMAGQLIERAGFPLGYQLTFLGFTAAACVSYHYSHRIVVADHDLAPPLTTSSPRQRVRALVELVRGERPFVAFEVRRFVFGSGVAMATPLLPLYYVQAARAPDAWIGVIGMSQAGALLVGYNAWRRISRRRSSGFVLAWATAASALYPAALAMTRSLPAIAVLTALWSLFAAGASLSLFDHLMGAVPPSHGVTFVSIDQSMQSLSRTVAPLVGGALALGVGLGPALVTSSVLSLAGAALFMRRARAAVAQGAM